MIINGELLRCLFSRFLVSLIAIGLVFPVIAYAENNILRMLVWEGYAPESFRKNFEDMILEKYGRRVKIQATYVEGSDDFYAPIRKKEVDLVTLTHHHFNDERFNYISNGLLLPLETKNMSRYQDVIPNLRDANYFRKGNNVYGIPICQGLYALVYNKDKVIPAPRSWRVLWSQEYKGDYVLGAKEYLYNICTVALTMGYPREWIGQFDKLNNEAFKKQLRSLALNAGAFWIGQDKADDLYGRSLSAGWGDSLSVLRKRGEDWRVAEPEEGSMCWVDSYALTWALAKKPFLKKVAEEWINFLLNTDFQIGYIIHEISQRPTIATIGHELTGTEKKKIHIGDANSSRENCILLPTYSQRDRNGLNLLWEEAMKGIKIEASKNP